jgi:hypothetical protein
MAEITNAGYKDIRSHIEDAWKYHELRDIDGNVVVRLSTSDSRVNWTHDPLSQILEITTVIRGSDDDIILPKSFASSALYNVGVGGEALSVEGFSQFTIEAGSDQLTVRHRIEVPRVI